MGLLATAGLAVPGISFAKVRSFSGRTEKSLSFVNQHTGERLKNVVFWEKGRYLQDGLDSINHLCRDFRSGEIMPIDPRLLDILYEINKNIPVSRPENIVISGYRSPRTNAKLRSEGRNVAKKSYHLKGKALDIRLTGCDLRVLKKVALNLRQGGVGYYPRSGFVHLDTGPVRAW